MSRWDQAKKWLKKPVSLSLPGRGSQQGREYAPGHAPSDVPQQGNTVNKRKARREKDEVDRKTRMAPELRRKLEKDDGVPKPYDANFLKEIASHPVAQAYIDTMAQDAATAPWAITQRDERIEVSDEVVAEAERTLEDLHPEKSFRDLREMAARDTLKLGDGSWVVHFFNDGGLAEAVPVDSARMFKVIDEHGMTEGYIEVSHQQRDVVNTYDLEEVVWFEWASRASSVYGQGPVQKGAENLEVLEELSDKELKDLTEGMPPGIVSVKEDEDTPMAVDAYENVKQNWGLKEGERHRAIVSMGDWQFTPLSPGYQELQFLERNKFWIHVLGAVFKVNAPYAGFDFAEGNKAQNMAQHEAQAQRGFRVLLRQMEEAINRQLIWPHISEDIQFEFEMERSTQEQKEQAEYLQALGEAAEQWDNLGREVSYRDGTIDIEDGEIDAPEDSGGDGGLGGMFGGGQPGEGGDSPPEPPDDQPDIPTPDQEDVEQAAKGNDGEGLTKEQAQKADDILLDAYKSQVWPEDIDQIEKRTWTGDESVPEYVIRNIKEAINSRNAVFDAIESVPEQAQNRLESILEDNLTQDQGWSLRSIVDDMRDQWPGVPKEDLEVVARTETSSVLNEAREIGYESMPDQAQAKFYWQGPSDSRTTEACEELKQETNPQHGGTPLSMNDLVRLEQEVQAQHFDNLSFRKHCVHPNERHTFVRQVDAAIDEAGF